MRGGRNTDVVVVSGTRLPIIITVNAHLPLNSNFALSILGSVIIQPGRTVFDGDIARPEDVLGGPVSMALHRESELWRLVYRRPDVSRLLDPGRSHLVDRILNSADLLHRFGWHMALGDRLRTQSVDQLPDLAVVLRRSLLGFFEAAITRLTEVRTDMARVLLPLGQHI